jgi:hypothetical protein
MQQPYVDLSCDGCCTLDLMLPSDRQVGHVQIALVPAVASQHRSRLAGTCAAEVMVTNNGCLDLLSGSKLS